MQLISLRHWHIEFLCLLWRLTYFSIAKRKWRLLLLLLDVPRAVRVSRSGSAESVVRSPDFGRICPASHHRLSVLCWIESNRYPRRTREIIYVLGYLITCRLAETGCGYESSFTKNQIFNFWRMERPVRLVMLRAIMIGSVTGYFSRAVAQKQALLLLPFGLQRACGPNLNSCGALGRGYKRALRVAQAA